MTWPLDIDPTQICQEKPRVLVSSCLLGLPVRYDGKHKHQPTIQQYLSPWIELAGHCPEVAAGMGTPRPPIQLVQADNSLRVRQVATPYIDVTASLATANDTWLSAQKQIPVAAILKARSPSCGSGTTPLHNTEGQPIASTSGFFVQCIQDQWPQLLVVDETQVATREQCQKFLIGCYLQQALNTETRVSDKLKIQLGWDDHCGLAGFFKDQIQKREP